MDVRIYYGAELGRYGFGDGHPFGPDRLDAFWSEARRQKLDRQVEIGAPVLGTELELQTFHPAAYLARVKLQSRTGEGYLDAGDTPAFKGVYEAARYVVGTTLSATRALLKTECVRAFVPIGGLHHARRAGAAGFCVFNDIGIAIEVARREFDIRRIAYIDIDAHHGDGVYYEYESDPDVFIADVHEDGRFLYPGTGARRETGTGHAQGTKLNFPMPPGADDHAFMRVWPEIEEFVRAAKPELILFQAGADSIKGDPITHMEFTPRAHAHATARLCKIAEEYCDGRLLGFGGGGYNRDNIAATWSAVVTAMLE